MKTHWALGKKLPYKPRPSMKGRIPWNKGITKLDAPQLQHSGVKKGHIPWNKGLTKLVAPQLQNSGAKKGRRMSTKEIETCRKLMIKRWSSGKFKGTTGMRLSAEHKQKISESHKGDKSYQWKGGLPECKDCKKILSTRKNSTGYCIKCYIKFAQNTGVYQRIAFNSMKKRGISKLEKKVLKTIEKHNLPYKFVGDGQFKIGGKVPDFVNTNGKKIAVETYYEGHKKHFRGGLEEWKTNRQEIFKEYGWEIVFIPEYFSGEERVLEFLRGGYSH